MWRLAEFFGKFYRVLVDWLNFPGVAFSEVGRWYQFWRGHFSDVVLAAAGLETDFATALDMMGDAMARRAIRSAPAGSDNATYFSVLEASKLQKSASLRFSELLKQSGGSSAHEYAGGRTFRDVVEEFAATHDVSFVGTGQLDQNGNQLWLFGGVSCYIDNHVMYHKQRGGGATAWIPITLEDLLGISRNSK